MLLSVVLLYLSVALSPSERRSASCAYGCSDSSCAADYGCPRAAIGWGEVWSTPAAPPFQPSTQEGGASWQHRSPPVWRRAVPSEEPSQESERQFQLGVSHFQGRRFEQAHAAWARVIALAPSTTTDKVLLLCDWRLRGSVRRLRHTSPLAETPACLTS